MIESEKENYPNNRQMFFFLKNNSLPIYNFPKEYMDYFLDLYEEHYNSRTLFNNFKNTAKQVGGFQALEECNRKLTEDAFNFIKNTDGYKKLKNDNLEDFKIEYKDKKDMYFKNVERKDFYISQRKNKRFVSIDLKNANYQVLFKYAPDIFNGEEDYVDFLSMFTDLDYFKNMKHIRQVILGKTEPKKSERMAKFAMYKIFKILVDNGVDFEKLVFVSSDELIFDITEKGSIQKVLKDGLINEYKYHLEVFQLKKVHENLPGFIKLFEDGSFKIKKVPTNKLAVMVKYLKNDKLEDNDFLFIFEEQIAFFKDKKDYRKGFKIGSKD